MQGRLKPGPKPMDAEEKEIQAAIMAALQQRDHDHRQKVRRDMKEYWKNHKRLGKKALAAQKAGLSYGYYVALALEKRGRLYWTK
jgi:hypothetical protein